MLIHQSKKSFLYIYSPFVFLNEVVEQTPLILDPITYLNVGKSSFRIEEIKCSFIKAFNFLCKGIYQPVWTQKDSLNGLFGISLNK